jgi:hypothetical protein
MTTKCDYRKGDLVVSHSTTGAPRHGIVVSDTKEGLFGNTGWEYKVLWAGSAQPESVLLDDLHWKRVNPR